MVMVMVHVTVMMIIPLPQNGNNFATKFVIKNNTTNNNNFGFACQVRLVRIHTVQPDRPRVL